MSNNQQLIARKSNNFLFAGIFGFISVVVTPIMVYLYVTQIYQIDLSDPFVFGVMLAFSIIGVIPGFILSIIFILIHVKKIRFAKPTTPLLILAIIAFVASSLITGLLAIFGRAQYLSSIEDERQKRLIEQKLAEQNSPHSEGPITFEDDNKN